MLRDGASFSPPRLRICFASSSCPCQRGPSEKTRTSLSLHTPSDPQLLPMMSLLRLAMTFQPCALA